MLTFWLRNSRRRDNALSTLSTPFVIYTCASATLRIVPPSQKSFILFSYGIFEILNNYEISWQENMPIKSTSLDILLKILFVLLPSTTSWKFSDTFGTHFSKLGQNFPNWWRLRVPLYYQTWPSRGQRRERCIVHCFCFLENIVSGALLLWGRICNDIFYSASTIGIPHNAAYQRLIDMTRSDWLVMVSVTRQAPFGPSRSSYNTLVTMHGINGVARLH